MKKLYFIIILLVLIIGIMTGCSGNKSTIVQKDTGGRTTPIITDLKSSDTENIDITTWNHPLKAYFESWTSHDKLISVSLKKNKTYPIFVLTNKDVQYPKASIDVDNEDTLYSIFTDISMKNGWWDYTIMTDNHTWEVANDRDKQMVLSVVDQKHIGKVINYNQLPCKATEFPSDKQSILNYLTKTFLDKDSIYDLHINDINQTDKSYVCQHIFPIRLMDKKTTANSFFIYDSWNGNLYNNSDYSEEESVKKSDVVVYQMGLVYGNGVNNNPHIPKDLTKEDFEFNYNGYKVYFGIPYNVFMEVGQYGTGNADNCNNGGLIGTGGDKRQYNYYTFPDQPTRVCKNLSNKESSKVDIKFVYADYKENTQISIYSLSIKTFRGLSVGDNESKMKELYGASVKDDRGDYVYKFGEHAISFTVKDSLISEINFF